ncbi:uncharacterized protein DFL_002383 [Arthrobotrys flagrans]|uniref:non-specific serine/threonine protein kinase n=1 Tax=Arthrobotrys flagrans TaxID=97331 RepID=A0A437AAR1_ARTFL|nr:hypothetical protein DFL_002383 [Arthrobotrys flagrans]
MAMEVGTPYQFDHVTHVGFDHTTGGFTGLPPEWEAVLRGEITAEEVNRRRNPPNYQRQNAMTAQRGGSGSGRRKKQSCFMAFLGKCFGSTYDDRTPSPTRIVSSSRGRLTPPQTLHRLPSKKEQASNFSARFGSNHFFPCSVFEIPMFCIQQK